MKPDFEKIIRDSNLSGLNKQQYLDSLSLLELVWKEAYNQAVDDCAESATTELTPTCIKIDKQSILKNKIP